MIKRATGFCPPRYWVWLAGMVLAGLLAGPTEGQADGSVVIGTIGDYGIGALGGQGPAIEGQLADLVKSWHPDFIITLGDNNYEDGDAATIDANIGQFYHEYIYPYLGTNGSGAVSNRFFPSPGNHDYNAVDAAPYYSYFTLPGNERYYNYRYGPVEIFSINSNPDEKDGITAGSVQALWLQSALAASQAKWKLVYFHHPPYSSGQYAPGIPELRWPFAEWGASAVLSGHDHHYERILDHGMLYLINGAGGGALYPFTTVYPGSQSRFNSDWGAMRIDATETNLVFQFFTRSNILVDTCILRAPIPDNLAVQPGSGFTASGPLAGPFTPSAQVFTLSNTGTNPLPWAAASAAGWMNLSHADGTISPGGPIDTVTAWLDPSANGLPAGFYTNTVWFTNLASGVVRSRQFALQLAQPDSFTQLFVSNANALAFQTFTFTPDGSPSYYSVCRAGGSSFPTDPAGGTRLQRAGDAWSALVTLSGSNRVSIYGQDTNAFYIGSSGYITFGSADASYVPSFATHFGLPRISALMDRLYAPLSSTVISWKEMDDRVAITFSNISEATSLNSNNFQIEIFFNGVIRLTYLRIDAQSALAGLSAGRGVPAHFVPSDLASYPLCVPPLVLHSPAAANEGDGLLLGQGQVSLAVPPLFGLAIHLMSSDTNAVRVPTSVVVPAGQTSASFDLAILDDALLDGTRHVTITASAPGLPEASALIAVSDNESASLTVNLPASVREGDGFGLGMVQVSAAPASDVQVELGSSDTTQIQVPPVVVLPAGQTSATYKFLTSTDFKITGPRPVTITAHVDHWVDGAATLWMLDSEPTNLLLTVVARVGEGGLVTNGGAVVLSGALQTNLSVALSSSDPARLPLPQSVLITAGQTFAGFNLAPIDNAALDGDEQVSVTASATGFGLSTASLTVVDDETPSAPSRPVPADFSSNVPVNISLSWGASDGEWMRNGGFETGDFSGWQKENSGVGDFRINDGSFRPEGGDVTVPPFSGVFSVVSSGTGSGRHALYQDVTIPSTIAETTLSWAECIRNFALDFAPDQYFRVEIRDTNNSVIEVLYTTQPGDPLLNGWTTRSVNLNRYGGRTIRIAWVEENRAGYLNVHLDNLSLQARSGPVDSFDVYFGTNASPGPAELLGSTTSSVWALPVLAPLTTYYWRVVAHKLAATPGPIWQFTTLGVDHFEWSAIASPQALDQPFSVNIAAKDGLNNTVSNFTGSINLAGSAVAGTNLTTPVSIAPTSTGPFAEGVWSGSILLQDIAPTMVLRATDAIGHGGQSNPFGVRALDDIGLTVSASADPAATGATLTYTLVVSNTGPSIANGLSLTNVLPASAPLGSFSSSQGSCSNLAGTIHCDLGSLAGGASAAVTITVVPSKAGSLTNLATVSRAGVDPYLSNNTIRTVTGVTLPSFAISDVSVVEGNTGTTPATFTVVLTGTSAFNVGVDYGTGDGTARAFLDYLPANGHLIFGPGVSTQTFTVLVLGDTVVESNLTFLASLGSPIGGVIRKGQAVGTILDDDGRPGALDHFGWATIPAPQSVNSPFMATITALDSLNAIATNYNGSVTLSASDALGSGTGVILGNPTADNTAQSGAYTLGYSFTPATNLLVTHVRHYSGSSVSIWTDDGLLLASQRVQSIPGTWLETPLVRPLPLAAGLTYRVAYFNDTDPYFWRLDLPSTFAAGTINGSYQAGGEAFPSSTDGARWWFVDLRYITVASLALAGDQSGNFTNGIWSGPLSVTQPARSAFLEADDGDGHQGLSTQFPVLLRDDVAVTLTDSPDVVGVGESLVYWIKVTNTGPSVATGVTLTNVLPSGVGFISASSSQGTCNLAGGTVTCNFGSLAGGSNALVSINVLTLAAGDITNQVTLWRAEADSYIPNNSASTVTSVRTAGLSIIDAAVVEGDSGTNKGACAVLLWPVSSATVQVHYATSDGTALAGSDYLATNGTLVFQPGETNKTIEVGILGDIVWEPDETFLINLSSPSNAVLTRGQSTNSILNDDLLPGLSISDTAVAEGNAGSSLAVFTVGLFPPSSQAITVQYSSANGSAVAPADYTAVSNGQLTFNPGQTNRTFTVAVTGNTLLERNKTFSVSLFSPSSNAALAKAQGICTVLNDDGLPGSMDHFGFAPVPSPQYLNQPFVVTIAAQDAFNATVTNFNGSVALSATECRGSTTNMLLNSPTPDNFGLGDYTLGYSFTPRTNLLVTHVRHFSGAKVSIWTDTGALLASEPVDRAPGTWTETQLPKPLPLTGGSSYRIALYSLNSTSYLRTDLPAMFADGTLNFSCHSPGDVFPTNQDSGRWWFVDLRYTVGNLGAVPLESFESGNFTNGIWAGMVNVLNPGTNVQIRSDDLTGHVSPSGAFTVLQAGDLALTLFATPGPVLTNSPVSYSLGLFNPGPATATGLIVSNFLPAGVTLVSAIPSQGSCANAGGVIRCDLGALPATSNASVQILVLSPPISGDLTNRATVVQNQPDSNPTNNSAVAITLLPNLPPVVSLNSPTNGLILQLPANLVLGADAFDPDGVIRKVEFFNHGAKLGEATNRPFAFTWTNPAPGLDLLTAKATDDGGKLATSAPVNIIVVPVPSSAGFGLYAQYFDNLDFSGTTVTQVDPSIAFDRSLGNFPASPIAQDTFSVRWSGTVRPRYSENYTFTTYSDDGVRLYLNGLLLIDNWTDHLRTTNSAVLSLQAEGLYSLVMEYYQHTGAAVAYLSWSSASQVLQVIPSSQLYPLPGIVSNPVSTNALLGSNATLQVLAYGQPPLFYQWRSNGVDIPGATSTNLVLTNLLASSAADYSVALTNVFGAVTSAVATVNVGARPAIIQDPQSQIVSSGSNVTFSVSASGTLPLTYFWRRIGTNYPALSLNSSNSSLVVNNTQLVDGKAYGVIVSNLFGTAANRVGGASTSALLTVVSSQTTNVAANQGETTKLTVSVSTTAVSYQWVFHGMSMAGATNRILTLTNVQASLQGDYYAVVTSSAGSLTTLVATLTVILRDSDHDGMPDDWEVAHGFNPLDPLDALADADGDGMTNAAEYIAGTDPRDPLSVLKVALRTPDGTGAIIQFIAMPNIGYTVLYQTNLAQTPWLKLRDVAAQPGTNTIQLLDPDALSGGRRYYRIATPQQP